MIIKIPNIAIKILFGENFRLTEKWQKNRRVPTPAYSHVPEPQLSK